MERLGREEVKGYTVDAVQIVAKKGGTGQWVTRFPRTPLVSYITSSGASEGNFGSMIISMYQAAMANETTTHLHFY